MKAVTRLLIIEYTIWAKAEAAAFVVRNQLCFYVHITTQPKNLAIYLSDPDISARFAEFYKIIDKKLTEIQLWALQLWMLYTSHASKVLKFIQELFVAWELRKFDILINQGPIMRH